MAEHFVESYLISLGFDLNSEQGQRYLDMAKQIDKAGADSEKNAEKNDQQRRRRDQDAEKADKQAQQRSQQSVELAKKQVAAMAELRKGFAQVGNVWEGVMAGDILGAFTSGINGALAFKEAVKGIQKPAVPEHAQESAPQQEPHLEKSPIERARTELLPEARPMAAQQAAAEPTPQNAPEVITPNVDAKKVDAAAKSFGALNKQITDTGKGMKTLKTTAGQVIGGDGTAVAGAEAANQASAALLTSLTAAVGIGAAVTGVVAGTVAITKGMYDLADGVSTANTNIESMAAKMWISYGAAWQLQNTLSAMGKTTADLNDIALNPTLRQQFKELQQYQKAQLQLPADFQTVNQQWAQSIQLPEQELKMTLQYAQEIAGYDLSKTLVGPLNSGLSGAIGFVNELSDDFQKVEGWVSAIGTGIKDVQKVAEGLESKFSWAKAAANAVGTVAKDVQKQIPLTAITSVDPAAGGALSIGESLLSIFKAIPSATKPKSSAKASSPSSTSSPAMQVYNVPDAASVAPNSPTNYYNSKTSGDVTYSPTNEVKVYTSSDDPQSVASAVSGSMQANVDQAAIIKIMQGLQR